MIGGVPKKYNTNVSTPYGVYSGPATYRVETPEQANRINASRSQNQYAETQRKVDKYDREWERKIDATANNMVKAANRAEESSRKAGMSSDYSSSTTSTPTHSTHSTHSTRGTSGGNSDNTNKEQVAYQKLNDEIEELDAQYVALTNNTKLSNEERAKAIKTTLDLKAAKEQELEITKAADKEGLTVEQYKKQQLSPDIPNPKELADISFAPKLDLKNFNIEGILTYMQKLKEKQKYLTDIADAASQAGTAFSQLGQAIGGTAGGVISAMGSIAATIAQTIGQVIAMMTAAGVSSAMKLPFPANLAAAATVVAGLASIISSIKAAQGGSYADGGIVTGTAYHGDTVLARLNSGEAVLNKSQQSKLFNMINSGGTNAVIGQVEFKIAGSTLKGVLRNYDSKMKKIR